MRILRNIYNEFVVYKSILTDNQGVELKDAQMLALIIYKNLCPDDFADIQNEQGLIKQAFEDKYRFISEEKSRLQIEINELSNSIDDYKHEILESIKEIKIAMLVNLTKDQGIVKELWYGYYSGDMITANQILSDEFELDYFKEHNIERIVYYDLMNGRNNDINISNFNKAIEPYVKRIRK
ncbi:YobI family P-loop NTPase, partial [Phascolarctobacterium succinatutens]|uniref:YobI family P-loop NTPase n=1 Tax=Phascolarctobacterium succinatutens TaxID=626940 RepID=UPI0040268E9F